MYESKVANFEKQIACLIKLNLYENSRDTIKENIMNKQYQNALVSLQ